jgi:hypothetical protein
MPTKVKAFDYIKSAASGFLATCLCENGTCTCSDPDGQHFHTLNSNKDSRQMPNVIEKMTAAERKDLAAKIEAASEHMTAAERRDLIETLSAALGTDVKAKEAAERKNQILANIQDRTDTTGTGKRQYDYMQSHLRAKGVTEPLAELAWKTEREIDAIFAAANLAPKYRVGAKRFMGRMVNGRV